MAEMPFDSIERNKDLCRNIIEAFEHIERYLDGYNQKEFLIDSKTQDATTMRLQQILEYAHKLSEDRKKELIINWSSLNAIRNKIFSLILQ